LPQNRVLAKLRVIEAAPAESGPVMQVLWI
jgi:hypothetical protein